MSECSRRVGVVSIVLGCAVLSAVACSSTEKKSTFFPGEAGAAGALEAGAAGAGQPAGGSAGSPAEPEAGQGGTAGADSAGAPSSLAGSGGAGPLACAPAGSVTSIAIMPSGTPESACRGARILTTFTGTTDTNFTCCGVSNSAQPYAVTVTGERTQAAGDDLLVQVPANAPLGVTSITMTCSSGPVTPTVDFDVIDKAPPVVSNVDASIFADGTLTITGENLQGVSQVTAIPVSGVGDLANCFYGSNISATSISCVFDGVAPGDYYIAVEEANCGYAVNTPMVTIKPVL